MILLPRYSTTSTLIRQVSPPACKARHNGLKLFLKEQRISYFHSPFFNNIDLSADDNLFYLVADNDMGQCGFGFLMQLVYISIRSVLVHTSFE